MPRASPAWRPGGDLERIENLTLEDFAVDVSKVEVPETQPGRERLSEPQMDAVVESFLASLNEGRTR